MKYPMIIAHRGASAYEYENSYAAFQLAINQGADMIELDTHLTSDGYFIVHHDEVIKFEDKEYEIQHTSLDVIKELKLPNGEDVPLLADVLEEFLPSIAFNIEIKSEKIRREQFEAVLTSINANSQKIIVSSFHQNVLEELKDSQFNYSLAFLYIFPTLINLKIASNKRFRCVNPFYLFLTKRRIKKYQREGKCINVWVVNKRKWIKRFVKNGVDGIITDKPLNTINIIDELLK